MRSSRALVFSSTPGISAVLCLNSRAGSGPDGSLNPCPHVTPRLETVKDLPGRNRAIAVTPLAFYLPRYFITWSGRCGSLRARLAEPQPRRVARGRPRSVTHVMAVIRVVLVPVAPFPAALSAGELRAARQAAFLAGYYGKLIVGHLRDRLRCCWPCTWPGGPRVIVAAAPAGDTVAMTAYALPDMLPCLSHGSYTHRTPTWFS